MCPPTVVRADDDDPPLNPGLDADPIATRAQWGSVLRWLVHDAGGKVATFETDDNSPFAWQASRGGLVRNGIAVPANSPSHWRSNQQSGTVRSFESAGFIVEPLPPDRRFAGAADAQFDDAGVLWVAYGPHTDAAVPWALSDRLGGEIRSLTLATRRFGLLERCFRILPGRRLLWHPPGFDPVAADAIRSEFPASHRREVEMSEAENGACCALVHGRRILLADGSAGTRSWLLDQGLLPEVVRVPDLVYYGAGPGSTALSLDCVQEGMRGGVNSDLCPINLF